tara:strand:- start:6381 stop:6593 length:213 start_codon:yes stop_codon:yes gene_type:complete
MKINPEILSTYLKLSALVTVALAAAMQKFILGAGYTALFTSKMLIASLPMALPYANIISLCFMSLYLFLQ